MIDGGNITLREKDSTDRDSPFQLVMEKVDEKAHDKDDLPIPIGIPATEAIFRGLVRASMTIA